MTRRVQRLRELASEVAPPRPVTIKGHRFDIACHRIRDFLRATAIAFRGAIRVADDLARSSRRTRAIAIRW